MVFLREGRYKSAITNQKDEAYIDCNYMRSSSWVWESVEYRRDHLYRKNIYELEK